jgi:hypothetical protein
MPSGYFLEVPEPLTVGDCDEDMIAVVEMTPGPHVGGSALAFAKRGGSTVTAVSPQVEVAV